MLTLRLNIVTIFLIIYIQNAIISTVSAASVHSRVSRQLMMPQDDESEEIFENRGIEVFLEDLDDRPTELTDQEFPFEVADREFPFEVADQEVPFEELEEEFLFEGENPAEMDMGFEKRFKREFVIEPFTADSVEKENTDVTIIESENSKRTAEAESTADNVDKKNTDVKIDEIDSSRRTAEAESTADNVDKENTDVKIEDNDGSTLTAETKFLADNIAMENTDVKTTENENSRGTVEMEFTANNGDKENGDVKIEENKNADLKQVENDSSRHTTETEFSKAFEKAREGMLAFQFVGEGKGSQNQHIQFRGIPHDFFNGEFGMTASTNGDEKNLKEDLTGSGESSGTFKENIENHPGSPEKVINAETHHSKASRILEGGLGAQESSEESHREEGISHSNLRKSSGEKHHRKTVQIGEEGKGVELRESFEVKQHTTFTSANPSSPGGNNFELNQHNNHQRMTGFFDDDFNRFLFKMRHSPGFLSEFDHLHSNNHHTKQHLGAN